MKPHNTTIAPNSPRSLPAKASVRWLHSSEGLVGLVSFSRFLHGKLLQDVHGHGVQCISMRGFQVHGWCHASFVRFFPPGHTEAPAVAVTQAREVVGWGWRHEIVPSGSAEEQEFLRDLCTHGVFSIIHGSSFAESIPIEPCHWCTAAQLQRLPKHVRGGVSCSLHPVPSTCPFLSALGIPRDLPGWLKHTTTHNNTQRSTCLPGNGLEKRGC